MFEVLFKKFLFVHGLSAHHDEDLSLFESICFKKGLLNHMDNRFELLDIVDKFLKDIDKTR